MLAAGTIDTTTIDNVGAGPCSNIIRTIPTEARPTTGLNADPRRGGSVSTAEHHPLGFPCCEESNGVQHGDSNFTSAHFS